jgi:hypothetical protein
MDEVPLILYNTDDKPVGRIPPGTPVKRNYNELKAGCLTFSLSEIRVHDTATDDLGKLVNGWIRDQLAIDNAQADARAAVEADEKAMIAWCKAHGKLEFRKEELKDFPRIGELWDENKRSLYTEGGGLYFAFRRFHDYFGNRFSGSYHDTNYMATLAELLKYARFRDAHPITKK